MNDRLVTRKQLAALLLASLLSPLLRVVPRVPAALAGRAAWLTVVPAALALLLPARLMASLRRRLRPGEGMADLILRLLGPVFGRLVLILYGAWFLFYAGFILRSGAERLAAAVYQRSGPEPFILVLLALCLVAALGKLRAAARMAVFMRALLLAALAAVALLALPELEADNLFPLEPDGLARAVPGAWPVLTVGGAAALFSFLSGYAEPPARPVGWLLPSLGLYCGAAAVLCVLTVGTFGAALTARLSYPFFTLVRDVSLFGLHQRIEAVVIVLWVFADYMLCTVLLRCANEALRTCLRLPPPEGAPYFSLRRGRWLLWLEAPAVWACTRLVSAESQRFLLWSQTLVPLITAVFVFAGFPLLWLIGLIKDVTGDEPR